MSEFDSALDAEVETLGPLKDLWRQGRLDQWHSAVESASEQCGDDEVSKLLDELAGGIYSISLAFEQIRDRVEEMDKEVDSLRSLTS